MCAHEWNTQLTTPRCFESKQYAALQLVLFGFSAHCGMSVRRRSPLTRRVPTISHQAPAAAWKWRWHLCCSCPTNRSTGESFSISPSTVRRMQRLFSTPWPSIFKTRSWSSVLDASRLVKVRRYLDARENQFVNCLTGSGCVRQIYNLAGPADGPLSSASGLA